MRQLLVVYAQPAQDFCGKELGFEAQSEASRNLYVCYMTLWCVSVICMSREMLGMLHDPGSCTGTRTEWKHIMGS